MTRFVIRKFNKLSVKELFLIYQLRSKVFVVEQNCAYQDVDEKDLLSTHVLLFDKKTLSAYARIISPLFSHQLPAIGRVVVDSNYRGKKYGYLIMNKCIAYCKKNYNGADVIISAQLYLVKFYENLGFKKVGKAYLEDNIPHIKMKLIFS